MSEQENIRITRKLFDSLNSHDVNENIQYLANDVKTTGTGAPKVLDKEGSRAYTQQFMDAFPDLHFDVKEIIAQGDWVAATWTARGTHNAPLVSPGGDTIPPTHKKTEVPGSTIFQFKNDKVVRQEIYWDMMTLLMQLGVVTNLAQLTRQR